MSDNPYSAPQQRPGNSKGGGAQTQVKGPAIGLIIVSSVCIFVVLGGLLFTGFLLISGFADTLPQPENIGISKQTQLIVRMTWSMLIIACNIIILMAAINMLKLRKYGLARVGAVLAVIPCVGPCYLLGLPFGIWALVVLSRPEVKDAFKT